MKIALLFMAAVTVVKFIAGVISSAFRYFKKEKYHRNQFAEIGMVTAKTVERLVACIDSRGNGTALSAIRESKQNGISLRERKKMI